jgi:hypothetical protein
MIAAAELEGCSSIEAVAALFARLGYPMDVSPIDPREWGLDDESCNRTSMAHGCRIGNLDLFLASPATDQARRAVLDLLGRIAPLNAVRRTVFCLVRADGFSIVAAAGARRFRRLDVPVSGCSADTLDRLNCLRLDPKQGDVAGVFERALDREATTRKFFIGFRSAVSDLERDLRRQCPDETDEQLHDQALLLMSRLLFLHFVQKKGWLDGNPRFLSDRYRQRREGRYFDRVLRPLFFGCLNRPVDQRDAEARALGAIPYLNGGLFHPTELESRHPELTLDDRLLGDILEQLFERFSFSVDEVEGEALQIDPEMLGKVFESLMRSDERLDSGSFYTPRVLVDDLTVRSIAAWLARGDEALMDQLVTGCDTGELLIEPAMASRLRRTLSAIRLVDPACGSGAFLLSSLFVLERLDALLATAAGEPAATDVRRRIVESSLFGVDLKPEAVRLCELRLWLAIVSRSEQAIDQLPPLPNLDRNIFQGNSLFGPADFLLDRGNACYLRWKKALQVRGEITARYRHASPEEKPRLVAELRESDRLLSLELLDQAIAWRRQERAQLAAQKSLPGVNGDARIVFEDGIEELRKLRDSIDRGQLAFFSFEVHFSQILEQGGFDLVAGNPPWVRHARIDPSTRRQLTGRFRFFAGENGRGFRQGDLSLAFCEKAMSLLAPDGVLAFLMPAKIATAGYASVMREELTRTAEIISIEDWSPVARDLFEADTFPLGLLVRRRQPGEATVRIRNEHGVSLVSQRELTVIGGSEWSLAPARVRQLIDRLRRELPPLHEALGRRPVMGVKTGNNRRFFLGEVVIEGQSVRLQTSGLELPSHGLCRMIRGRDVGRWKLRGASWMLWPPTNGTARAPQWLERFSEEIGVLPELLRLAYVRPEHLGVKVVWTDVSRGIRAVAVPDRERIGGLEFPLVPNQTTYCLDASSLEEALTVSAVLNSSLAGALAVEVAERAKDAHFRYFGSTVGAIPWPRLDAEERDVLAKLARRGQLGQPVDRELDRFVARSYGVSARELELVQSYLHERLGS